ncbi:MAG: response regulator transcription factor [Chloroflexi bacterium]|nr:response regulator transcription factor [Chloroflexota bacterium]MYE39417.1 response regulator transcription factor [Chloroflexota bacterium]
MATMSLSAVTSRELDPDAVLQEAVDRARSLTGARYGAILTFDDSGRLRDVFTSGAGPEERETVEEAGTSKQRARVLAVDQDPRTLRHIRNVLSAAGYFTIAASGPDEVERLVQTAEPDLVLLDLALPDINGIELLRRIQKMTDAPVVFLLDSEAGDCIVKPFSPAELVAGIEAILHRRQASGRAGGRQPYRSGELVIDYDARRVTVAGRPVRLTATEYKLAVELSANAGRTMTQDQLLTRVWGASYPSDSQLLRTFIKKLRGKLGDSAGSPAYIFTDHRVGYRMALPESRRGGDEDSGIPPIRPVPCVGQQLPGQLTFRFRLVPSECTTDE